MLQNVFFHVGIVIVLSLSSCQTPQPQHSQNSSSQQTSQYLRLGNEYAKDGLIREAIDAYKQELKEHPDNVLAKRNLGFMELKAGNFSSAVKQLEAVIAHFDSDYQTNFNLAEAYRGLERYAEAIYRYQKALKIRPDAKPAQKALAWSYYKIHYYKAALSLAKELYKKDPQDGQAAIILARIYLKLNKPKTALRVIKRSQKYAPQSAIAYFNSVAGDAYLALNRCSKALPIYQQALKAQPLLAGALLGLGRCLLKVGKYSEATKYLERSARIRPQEAETYFYLARAASFTDKAKATKYYKKFLSLASSDPMLRQKIRQSRQALATLKNNKETSAQ